MIIPAVRIVRAQIRTSNVNTDFKNKHSPHKIFIECRVALHLNLCYYPLKGSEATQCIELLNKLRDINVKASRIK